MAACEFCLQDGGVSESFTHNMAALKFCLQNGGVSKSFTHKMAGGRIAYKMAAMQNKQKVKKTT